MPVRPSDEPGTKGISRRSLIRMAPAAVVGGLLAGTAPRPAEAASRAATTVPPKTIAYVEVNNYEFYNVADYTLQGTSRPTFDMAMIFAANINYNSTKKQAYLHYNDRVGWILRNADTQIRPVQDAGIEVLLTVLGNHEGAGFANFANYGAADRFAAQLADAVSTYDLDGIDFDDEFADYGDNGTSDPNESSFVYLLEALRKRLGSDKLITFYNIGPSAEHLSYGGTEAGSLLDYAYNPYYGQWNPPQITGMAKARLGAAAVDLSQTSQDDAVSLADQTVDEGYGVYVTYNLTSTDQADYLSGITQALNGHDTIYREDAS